MLYVGGNSVSFGTELLPLRKCNISSECVLIFIDMPSIYNVLVKLVS